MRRDILTALADWKNSKRRKPLLLRGARQTGKTYLLQEFGASAYERCHYFNFEEEPALASVFEPDLDPERIIRDLSLLRGTSIRRGKDLIILDEVQFSNGALNSLKYFQERAGGYHIAAAGSLLGVTLSKPRSFPVGKVTLMTLTPMTFYEFLDALDKSAYRQRLESLSESRPTADAVHQALLSLLRTYYLVGGMPEAVQSFVDDADFGTVRQIQRGIVDAYVLDFAKYPPTSDVPKLTQIWNSLPAQLARENKRFLFSAAKEGARAREYENALLWLENAGAVIRSFCVDAPRRPLTAYANRSLYKMYVLDVGLLGAVSGLAPELLLEGDALFTEFRGALAENYVCQELRNAVGLDVFYWRNPRGHAEVDFVLESGGSVVPLEVKAGINPRSRSLRAFADKYGCERLYRTTALNFRRDGAITNIPLYAVGSLPNLVRAP